MPIHTSYPRRFLLVILQFLLLASVLGMAGFSFAAPANDPQPLAAIPPMGWNDWAHYQCSYTAQTILD